MISRLVHGSPEDESSLLGGAERVIATLTRTSPESKGRLKNMLASIQKFYSSKYKIVVFTEKDYDATHQAEIMNCTDLDVVFYKINLFEYLENKVTPQKAERWHAGLDGGIKGKKLSYRYMCKFWAVEVFRHPLFKNTKFLMRMDDDSYFTSQLEEDPFDVMEREQLDYGYRSWFTDKSLVHNLWNLTASFIAKESIKLPDINTYGVLSKGRYNGKAVYNNFFVVRTEVWRRPVIHSYLNHLVDNHGFLKFKHGDANVHALALTLGVEKKKTKQFKFGYNHNCHVHGKGEDGFTYRYEYRDWLKILKCRQIAKVDTNGKITFIKL